MLSNYVQSFEFMIISMLAFLHSHLPGDGSKGSSDSGIHTVRQLLLLCKHQHFMLLDFGLVLK